MFYQRSTGKHDFCARLKGVRNVLANLSVVALHRFELYLQNFKALAVHFSRILHFHSVIAQVVPATVAAFALAYVLDWLQVILVFLPL